MVKSRLKTFKENFGDWAANMKELTDEESGVMKEKFDKAVEDSHAALLDDLSNFEMAETDWTPEDKEAFCKVLCPEFFEVEDDE